MEATRICKTCGEEKPLDAYYVGGPGRYRRRDCKVCVSVHIAQVEPERVCKVCGVLKPIERFAKTGPDGKYRARVCKKCRSSTALALRKERYTQQELSAAQHASNLRRKRGIGDEARLWTRYGMTPPERDELMKSQHGRCAICDIMLKPTLPRTPQSAHIDHCHKSGLVRGMLCIKCNTMLGLIGDDPLILERAGTYIKEQGVALARERRWSAARFLNAGWVKTKRFVEN